MSSQTLLFDPDPTEWFTAEKKSKLVSQLSDQSSFLRQSGLYIPYIRYWVKLELSSLAPTPDDAEQVLIDEQVKEWIGNNQQQADLLFNSEIKAKFSVSPALSRWTNQHWSHLVEKLYLSRKSHLDKVSFGLIRHLDKDFLMEIYHRIRLMKSHLSTLQELWDGTRGTQWFFSNISFNELPYGLEPLLRQIRENIVTQPIRMNKGFCIVRLDKLTETKLDDKVRSILLSEHLSLWTNYSCAYTC